MVATRRPLPVGAFRMALATLVVAVRGSIWREEEEALGVMVVVDGVAVNNSCSQ